MNLVSRKNEIVLIPIVVKAKANDDDDSRIIAREIAKIQRVEIDLWSNRILKPPSSFDRLKKGFSPVRTFLDVLSRICCQRSSVR